MRTPDDAGGVCRDVVSFDELYQVQWWPMVRLATGLVDHMAAAEDVVQDAFAALYRRWSALDDPGAAVGYLRASVVNGSRSVLRRRMIARKHLRAVHLTTEEVDGAADEPALLSAEHEIARRALSTLPTRQREVLTLRYLADLPDTEIAAATGLSLPGVRSASSRGLAALRLVLEEQL